MSGHTTLAHVIVFPCLHNTHCFVQFLLKPGCFCFSMQCLWLIRAQLLDLLDWAPRSTDAGVRSACSHPSSHTHSFMCTTHTECRSINNTKVRNERSQKVCDYGIQLLLKIEVMGFSEASDVSFISDYLIFHKPYKQQVQALCTFLRQLYTMPFMQS